LSKCAKLTFVRTGFEVFDLSLLQQREVAGILDALKEKYYWSTLADLVWLSTRHNCRHCLARGLLLVSAFTALGDKLW